MRVWRSREGFVAEGPVLPVALVSPLDEHLPAGPCHAYTRIDLQGRVRDILRPGVWSIEDELGAEVYAVVGGALRHYRVSVFCGASFRVRREEKEVEGGLRYASGDPEALRVVNAALAALDDEGARRSREADARLADIPGALEDYGAGSDFRKAQEALAARYRAYGHSLDREVLATLARFGRLHRLLGSHAAFIVARDAYVVACRLLAFDRSLPPGTPSPTPSAGPLGDLPAELREDVAELARSLDELGENVFEHAERQEDVDARLNALEMKKACREMVRARQALA
jgi:hypothetical protein